MKLTEIQTMSTQKRPAFTLVELLVSMALTMFIMVILSQTFVTSLQVFSGLKAIGDMQANLRTVTTLLQDDLSMDHFEGRRRLSDPDLPLVPLRQGFFYIHKGTPPSVNPTGAKYIIEGHESGKPVPALGPPFIPQHHISYRATDHALHFTVKSRGNELQNYFAVPVPAGSPLLSPNVNFFGQPPDSLYQVPGSFNSQWAEVAYFLVQTGSTDEPNNPSSVSGTPLHALYRSAYLLVPNPAGAVPSVGNAQLDVSYSNISCYKGAPLATGNLVFNSPEDVVTNTNRILDFSTSPPAKRTSVGIAPGIAPKGASVVLTNVVSFQVQVYQLLPPPAVSFDEFVDVGPLGAGGGFDTFPAPSYSIRALKITIRVWDSGTKQSRQVTLVQDM